MKITAEKGDRLFNENMGVSIVFEGMGRDGLPRYHVDVRLPAIAPSNLVTSVRIHDYDGGSQLLSNEEAEIEEYETERATEEAEMRGLHEPWNDK